MQLDAGVFVLGCHEVENLYLQPEALGVLLQRAGRNPAESPMVVRDAADVFAGLWDTQSQRAAATFAAEHDLPKEAISALS